MADTEQSHDTGTHPRDSCSGHQQKAHNAPISYNEALCRMKSVARQHKARLSALTTGLNGGRRECLEQSYEIPKQMESGNGDLLLPLIAAVGKECARAITVPYSIPRHDTSAMDGFAISSELTDVASKAEPVRFRISHIIAAGDGINTPIQKPSAASRGVCGTSGECVEIMTGARFPELSHPDLDAVVKIEDVVIKSYTIDCGCCSQYIEVSAPVKKHQNRRFAGSDLIAGAPIIAAGERITPNHVMALASVGYRDVRVIEPIQQYQEQQFRSTMPLKGIKIGVLSTGSELNDACGDPTDKQMHASDRLKQVIPNSNGPYIISRLRQIDTSVDVQYLGIAQDSEEDLEAKLRDGLHARQLDVIVSTGGVSMGKFDLVRPVLEQRMHARVVFHGVKVRPGLPILFALLDHEKGAPGVSSAKMTAFFGLPGNPIATAMALRFFVIPYLATLSQLNIDGLQFSARISLHPQKEEHRHTCSHEQGKLLSGSSRSRRTKPSHLSVFWLSRRHQQHDTPLENNQAVDILEDQASYKMGTLLQADCWVEVPAETCQVVEGDLLTAHQL